MSRREFSGKVRDQAHKRAGGLCEGCGAVLGIAKYHFDHILPDALGGAPTLENCALLCVPCHNEKTGKRDVPMIRKSDRAGRIHRGTRAPKVKIPQRPKPPRISKPSLVPLSLYADKAHPR